MIGRLTRVYRESGPVGVAARALARTLRGAGLALVNASDRLYCALPAKWLTPATVAARLAANADLENAHAGERCFILGTGPSLLDEPVQLLRGESIFVVNQGFLYARERRLRPAYAAIIDDIYLESRFQPLLEDLAAFCRDSDATLLCTTSLGDGLGPIAADVPRYEIAPIMRSRYFDETGRPVPVDLRNVQPGHESVIHFAIVAALFMGFREIYLLGCDMDYFLRPERPFRHCYARSPHLDDDKSAGELFERDQVGLMEWALAEFRAFRQLRQVAEARGQSIFNATQGGCLEVFRRRTLADVFDRPATAPFDNLSRSLETRSADAVEPNW